MSLSNFVEFGLPASFVMLAWIAVFVHGRWVGAEQAKEKAAEQRKISSEYLKARTRIVIQDHANGSFKGEIAVQYIEGYPAGSSGFALR